MGLFNRLFNRPPSRDKFAKLVLARIRISGETRPITYEPDEFRLVRDGANIMYLGNLYQEYLRSDADRREELIRRFLAMWHTADMPMPEEFDDAKADLLPALRARSYLEVDLRFTARGDAPAPPYEVIGEHLALSLVYDLPDSMRTVEDDLLEKWNVSFYEAMEVAKQNLREKPAQIAQIGPLYAIANGDGYDATRMVTLDLIRELKVEGDHVAMVPNRERLYVVGSEDDESLELMLKIVEEDLINERFISGMAFRLEGDEWQPWLPPQGHKLTGQFNQLRIQTLGRNYSDQAELLNKRHQRGGIDVFVASFSGIKNEATGGLSSYCMWADGVDALLPETDEVMFARPGGDGVTMAARADWQKVCKLVGHMMEPQDMYPERWRVREFPDANLLAQLGVK